MANIRSGRRAPDATLQDLNGRSHSLSDYWGDGRSLHIIFLRHLA